MNKICKLCHIDKPIDAYYLNRKTTYRHSNCLACVNKMRSSYVTNKQYVRKVTGLLKYSEEIQRYVRESIKNKIDIKEIAKNSNINISTLNFWVKTGRI